VKRLNYDAVIVYEDQDGRYAMTVENIIRQFKTDYEIKHGPMSDEMFIEEFFTIYWAWSPKNDLYEKEEEL
jgi:hypothetical protein